MRQVSGEHFGKNQLDESAVGSMGITTGVTIREGEEAVAGWVPLFENDLTQRGSFARVSATEPMTSLCAPLRSSNKITFEPLITAA